MEQTPVSYLDLLRPNPTSSQGCLSVKDGSFQEEGKHITHTSWGQPEAAPGRPGPARVVDLFVWEQPSSVPGLPGRVLEGPKASQDVLEESWGGVPWGSQGGKRS